MQFIKRVVKTTMIKSLDCLGRFDSRGYKAAEIIRTRGFKFFIAKCACKLTGYKIDENHYLYHDFPYCPDVHSSSIVRDSATFSRMQADYKETFYSVKLQRMAAFTIASKNYMQYALTLRESFLQFHPNDDFYIFLVDYVDTKREQRAFNNLLHEGVEILTLHQLAELFQTVDWSSMLYKYTIMEMNTAVKPFVLEYLMSKGYADVTYLDPDICFYGSMQKIKDELQESDIILLPHCIHPCPDDGKHIEDMDLLRSGIFNLGFIAIKNTKNALSMCRWWQGHLFGKCFSKTSENLFVDQVWMNFAPAFFDKVLIDKSPEVNAAYWNIHERKVYKKNDKWYANETPLVFFHYSGLPMNVDDCISKYTDRDTLKDRPEMKELFTDYKARVTRNKEKFESCRQKYYFGHIPGFASDINEQVRRATTMETLLHVRHPFSADMENSCKMASILGNSMYLERESNTFTPGINIISHFNKVIGTASVSRLIAKTLFNMPLPFSITPFDIGAFEEISSNEKSLFERYFVKKSLFGTNIIFFNADEMESSIETYEPFLKNKYNIGVWWWEFDDHFEFDRAFQCVDEVWVFSDFIKTAVEKKAPSNFKIRKVTFPLVADWCIENNRNETREKLGIPENSFCAYFNFDYNSCFERKNPVALLEAFAKFASKKSDVMLILKTLGSKKYTENEVYLKSLIKDLGIEDKVLLINKSIPRNEVMTIMSAMDVYVSLHRSEGLGMGMLEAMALGVPVVGTGYGGNMEFMTKENSILLDYKLVEVQKDFGPYKKGWLWANADIDGAADALEKMYADADFRKSLGEKGRESIFERFNPKKTCMDVLKSVVNESTIVS